jgi:ribonuclease P protein component
VNRRFRLTRSSDFQRVRQSGKSYAHPLLVLIALPSKEQATRIGVTAGRSVGKAVQRNRAKRILRSAIHPYLRQLRLGWDIILIARHRLLEATFQQTQAVLASLLGRASLLSNHERADEP